MSYSPRFMALLIAIMTVISLALLFAPAQTIPAADAATCLFNGRSSNPRIYNDGGAQGTIHLKRHDGSQIAIGVGASVNVCPYKIWISHQNVVRVRCSNGYSYWSESTWYNTFRYLSDDAYGGEFWICGVSGGSSSAHISIQHE